jgi:dTDP-4-amino-4,6-dideoxygalactose transaminase
MPNLNAALACAQLEQLTEILRGKRVLAKSYIEFFKDSNIIFKQEPTGTTSNYWLNAIQLEDLDARNAFLKTTNESGVMSRPIWTLMSKLPMFKDCERDDLKNSIWLEERIVNLPSSYINL